MRSDDKNPGFDSMESALNELDGAERAGVFRSSPVRAEDLVAASTRTSVFHLSRAARGWAAAAAAFFLVATISSLLFYRELGEMHERLSYSASQAPRVQVEAVLACFAGPTGSLSTSCHSYDADSDGDVDMADVSRQWVIEHH